MDTTRRGWPARDRDQREDKDRDQEEEINEAGVPEPGFRAEAETGDIKRAAVDPTRS